MKVRIRNYPKNSEYWYVEYRYWFWPVWICYDIGIYDLAKKCAQLLAHPKIEVIE